jgi:uncharacterized protein YndB with AHSA1/START domain
MPDILHKVGIKSSPDALYDALTMIEGLSAWWTSDTRGNSEAGGLLRFGFAMAVLTCRFANLVPPGACSGRLPTGLRSGSARR